jgi:dihydropyrimidinase
MGIVFKHGTLITASEMTPADVLVVGERIAHIGADIDPAGHETIDCAGKYLLPGGVDAHTHLHLPLAETSSNSDFDSGHRSAAFGGTTTHIDFAIQPRDGSLLDGLNIWQEKARVAQIDYSFHANFSNVREDTLAEIPHLADYGVTSIKVLMAYKESVQVDDLSLFRIMRLSARHGLLVMVHAENGDVEYELRHELLRAGLKTPNYHPISRPPQIEIEATNRAVTMAGLTGCPLYVVHMTNAGSVKVLRRGRAQGFHVMGETCPQYLTFTAAEHLNKPDFETAKYVCSPPLRTKADQEALWNALRDGTLQTIATDHCDFWFEGGVGPWREWSATHTHHDWAEYEAQNPDYRRPGKELGRDDFSRIPNGLPGIEDRMMVTWELGVNGRYISPMRFVELNCTNPAKIFGLYPRKGTLNVGADADIVVWNPNAAHIIKAEHHHMRTDYNCYEGLEVKGKPEKVYLRGRKIVDGERWLGENGYGQFLRRQPGIPML